MFILLRILRYLFYFYFILKLLVKSIIQLVVFIARKLKPIFYISLVIRQILMFSVFQFHFVFIIYMALVSHQIKFKFLSFSEGNLEIYLILFFLVFSFFHEWLREEQKSIFINILSSMLVITSLKSLLFLGTFDNLFFQFLCVS